MHQKKEIKVLLVLLVSFLCISCAKSKDPLSTEERAWLTDNDTKIIVAAEPDWPPITFFEDDGAYSGMVFDYLHLMENRLGCRFTLKKMKNWAQILEQAKTSQINVVMDVTPTPERSEYLNFTKPYIEIATVIITRKDSPGSLDVGQLNGLKVVVTEGFQITDYLRKNHPDIQLVSVDSTVNAIQRLSDGEFDAAITEVASASYKHKDINIYKKH